MSANTRIEWCDHTFNPWWGCSAVSPACDNCYARRQAQRFGGIAIFGEGFPRKTFSDPGHWNEPRQWNAAAKKSGVRQKVFCGSMCDIFERSDAAVVDRSERMLWVCDREPDRWIAMRPPETLLPMEKRNLAEGLFRPLLLDDVRRRLFDLIERTPQLDWLLLTKRADNPWQMAPSHWLGGWCQECGGRGYTKASLEAVDACYECGGGSAPQWPDNAWMGMTVEDQQRANERIPHLLKLPAPVRFVSCEPLLSEVVLNYGEMIGATPLQPGPRNGIDWVIAGGESGPAARPSHPAWFRSLRDQCKVTGVPYFFKQWGEWRTFNDVDELPGTVSDTTPVCLVKRDGAVIRPYCNLDGPGQQMVRVGKKRAGRTLDGREWSEFPQPKVQP